jgi:DNA-binding transcriptional ArsR family regulator
MAADLDLVFKALADPTRRLLLDRLFEDNGQTLGALCAQLAMSRQAVTKHLDVLEGATLVTSVRRGREKLHYLNPEPIEAIAERWIGKYERRRLQALRDLKHSLEQEDSHQQDGHAHDHPHHHERDSRAHDQHEEDRDREDRH